MYAGYLSILRTNDFRCVFRYYYGVNTNTDKFCFTFQFSGQPLLHKAVLHGYAEITQLLADTIVNVTRQKIDSIRDQVSTVTARKF